MCVSETEGPAPGLPPAHGGQSSYHSTAGQGAHLEALTGRGLGQITLWGQMGPSWNPPVLPPEVSPPCGAPPVDTLEAMGLSCPTPRAPIQEHMGSWGRGTGRWGWGAGQSVAAWAAAGGQVGGRWAGWSREAGERVEAGWALGGVLGVCLSGPHHERGEV